MFTNCEYPSRIAMSGDSGELSEYFFLGLGMNKTNIAPTNQHTAVAMNGAERSPVNSPQRAAPGTAMAPKIIENGIPTLRTAPKYLRPKKDPQIVS